MSWWVLKHISLEKAYSSRSIHIRFGSFLKTICFMSFLFSLNTWSLKVTVFVILDLWLQK